MNFTNVGLLCKDGRMNAVYVFDWLPPFRKMTLRLIAAIALHWNNHNFICFQVTVEDASSRRDHH